MRGGQNIKPVEVRMREGNPGKSALPEPLLVSGRPTRDAPMLEPPEDLPADAKKIWRKVVPSLFDVGLLDFVDEHAIEGMCIAYARAKQAGKVVQRQGHLTRGSQGQLREHPSLRTERESWNQFYRFAEHFALTPVARTRLGLAEIHRRTLKAEFDAAIGTPDLEPIDDAEVVDDG